MKCLTCLSTPPTFLQLPNVGVGWGRGVGLLQLPLHPREVTEPYPLHSCPVPLYPSSRICGMEKWVPLVTVRSASGSNKAWLPGYIYAQLGRLLYPGPALASEPQPKT